MIYFAQAGPQRLVKIGTTVNLARRMINLRSILGCPIVVLGIVDGDKEMEDWFHLRFRHLGTDIGPHRNEWFFPDPDLMAYIRDHTRHWQPEDRPWERPIVTDFSTRRHLPPIGFRTPTRWRHGVIRH